MSKAIKKDALSNVTIAKKMRDYSKDPFVIKKKESAIAALKKYGLPDFDKKKSK